MKSGNKLNKLSKLFFDGLKIAMVGVPLLLTSCIPHEINYNVRISDWSLKHINPVTNVMFEFNSNVYPITVSIDWEGDGVYDAEKEIEYPYSLLYHDYKEGSYRPTFKCHGIEKQLELDIEPYSLDEAVDIFSEILGEKFNISLEGSGVFNYSTESTDLEIPYLAKFEKEGTFIAPKGKGMVFSEEAVKGLEDILESEEFPYSPFYLQEDGMWRYEIEEELMKYW